MEGRQFELSEISGVSAVYLHCSQNVRQAANVAMSHRFKLDGEAMPSMPTAATRDRNSSGDCNASAARSIVEIVKRSDAGKFVVLPKRWIVERTIGWLNRCRRLAKDWECLNRNALAFLRWASIRLMLRKLCQKTI